MLRLSCNVSDAFPKVLKLSSEVSECKPLGQGEDADEDSGEEGGGAPVAVHVRPPAAHPQGGAVI